MILLFLIYIVFPLNAIDVDEFYRSFEKPMDAAEKENLMKKTTSMMLHSYYSYKKICGHTCDYVKPNSCEPVYHTLGSSLDNQFYGNFSLTLVESLDTLALMGLYDEFYDAANKVIAYLNFDKDVAVSVFEMNIRVLGGLLSAHNLIQQIDALRSRFTNYNNELLHLAKDLGDRLLVAFTKSPTGIPYKQVYLNRSEPVESLSTTTTADVGSFVLEFCSLSHMTGITTYCDTALSSLDKLWSMKDNNANLPYRFLDSKSGKWVSSDITIGWGVDSYFEYLMKGYIMTGNSSLSERFAIHYKSIENHLKKNFAYDSTSRGSFNKDSSMDALQAFWPSIQLMHGDLKNALHLYYHFFKLLTSHIFLPESFSMNTLNPIDSNFNLRPELIESTYYLYRATNDPFFLNVGKFVLFSTENYCRSKCGYSVLRNKQRTKLDYTETFFQAEYLKYLFLLFKYNKTNPLPIDMDGYVFNTEGHPLPIFNKEITRKYNVWRNNALFICNEDNIYCDIDNLRTDREKVLKEIEERTKVSHNSFNDFQFHFFDEKNQQNYQIITNSPNNVMDHQHKIINYKSKNNDMEKPVFIKLSSVTVGGTELIVQVGVAFFESPINKFFAMLEGDLSKAEPYDACTKLTNSQELLGKIVMAIRGNCNFVVKARNIQRASGIAAYILNNQPSNDMRIHIISNEYHNDIMIPIVFHSLFDHKNKDILNLHQKILKSDNRELQKMKSTIFPTDLAINIVFN